MREIKFGGKTVSGEWVYGNLTVLRQTIRNVEHGSYISNDAGMPFAYRVMPETVGQSTGKQDTNGVEIYEGDILEMSTLGIWTGHVEYVDSAFCVKGVSYKRWLFSLSPKHIVIISDIPDAR